MKFLLWLLLILVVLHLLRKKKNAAAAAWRAAAAAAANPHYANRSASASTPSIAAAEQMVSCAHCGVYVPRSESISDSNEIAFCSDAHRRLHLHS